VRELPDQLLAQLLPLAQALLTSLLVIAAALLVRRVWLAAVGRTTVRLRRRAENQPRERQLKLDTLVAVGQATGTVLIFAIATLMVLSQFTDIAPLLAGVSVVGIAFGLGAQNVIRDLFGGFFILLEDHFGVGDVIKVNNQYDGLVEHLDLRRTVLRNLDGWSITIPNGEIRVVANLTRSWSRIVVDVQVPYETAVEQARAALEVATDRTLADPTISPLLLERPEVQGVEALGTSTMTLRVLLKTRPMKQWDVGRFYRAVAKQALEEARVAPPYSREVLTIHQAVESPPVAEELASRGR
jgi:small conductance mechanosensitive channel